MKVRCINNINKRWKDIKLPFTVGEIYDGIVDREFVNIVELYVRDDFGDEMTVASMDILEWSSSDCECWCRDKWFMDHFEIV